MVNGKVPRRDDERASLGQLVASLADNVSTLVRDEIALAKAEMQEAGKRFAAGGGLLAAAVFLLVMVFLLVTFAIVYGLSDGTGLPLWASFLIVGLVYLVIALILAFAGRKQLEKARGPEKASEAANETKQILSGLVPKTGPDTGEVPPAGSPGAPTPAPATSSPTAARPGGGPTGPAGAASPPSA
jgi:membrane protein implicated in regulation of membrane protease activity